MEYEPTVTKQSSSSNQVNNQVSNQVNTLQLTISQKDIISFCSVPRTAQEIMDKIGLTNQSINRRRHILSLVEIGVLAMTQPDSPNSPTQRYVLTEEGRKLLE